MATPNTLRNRERLEPAAIKVRLEEIAPWASYELQDGQWLLVAPNATTSQEVSDRLGLTGGDSKDTGVVLRIENYFGRNYQAVWDWISTKLGAEFVSLTHA